jgi:protein transport protein SEC61 subunit gamma-like protein
MADPTTPPLRDDEESLEQVVEQETAPKPQRAAKPEHKAGDKEGGFLDRAWEAQEKVERKWAGLGSGRFARVLRMARKPEPEEFHQSATIVLVGIGIIGGLGFGVYLLMGWMLKLLHA